MTRPLTVVAVVGARPNFMKVAPIIAEIARLDQDVRPVLVHTGQHYDDAMSKIFLDELGVGAPDHLLGVGSGSHAQMTARVMERIEPVLLAERPDVVLVPGDVNSTLASALVAVKLGIAVAHVEAGLRSFDPTMPEEVNRLLTDQVSEVLFTHSPEARENLAREGISSNRVYMVGNTMIDTLAGMRGRIQALGAAAKHDLTPGNYLVVTLHRPALVDGPLLEEVLGALAELARTMPVVFPCHPRTRARIDGLPMNSIPDELRLIEPLGYLEFLSLLEDAAGALTDSGGIQEETTYLGIPCFTLRENTERPVTCTAGTNVLLGLRPQRISEIPALLKSVTARSSEPPEGWDGRASERIVDVLLERFSPTTH